MKNKLLFDLTATQPSIDSKRHGGGKYGEAIFKRIIERKLSFSCLYDSRRWINPEIQKLINSNDIELFDVSIQLIQKIIDNNQFKTVFTAMPRPPFYSLQNVKVVGTIHGLRRLETPADKYCFLYKTQNWKDWIFYFANILAPRIIKNKLCDYYRRKWKNPNFNIVTVSNHTSNSIKVFFPEFHHKEIPVFYSPSTLSFNIIEKKYLTKYFLMVSGNRLEKNNLRAIKALDMLFSNGYLEGYRVKITGISSSKSFRYSVKNKDRFDFIGYVDDEELEQLYHDAYCLIYPSVNEGFGYPPLEAMHYGIPVISSPYTSIPEVCGEANLYFNPFSVEEIANRILQISDMEVYHKQSNIARMQYAKILEKQNKDLDELIDYIFQ